MKRDFLKNIFIGALMFSALASSSCSDWLEENPTTSTNLEVFTGEDAMFSLLMGAYSSIKNTYELQANLGVVGTDICMTQKNNNMNVAPMEQYSYTSSTPTIGNAWIRHFKTIQLCNIVIDRTEKDVETPPEVKNNIIGQARFLRAFCYFRLVQWFGALPIVTNETLSYDEFLLNIPRSSVKEVYDLILSDLLFASSEGILAEQITNGSVTRYAAKGLLAKVYLTMGTSMARLGSNQELLDNAVLAQYLDLPKNPEDYYRLSYNLCLEIINSGKFKLADNYSDLFSIEAGMKNTNGESMWEIQYSSQRGYGSQWSKQFGFNGGGGSVPSYNAMAGVRSYQPVPSFWGYYKKGDVRLSWNLIDRAIKYPNNDENAAPAYQVHRITIDTDNPEIMNNLYEDGSLNADISCTKYRWGSGNPDNMWNQKMSFAQDNCPNNVIVLRYADILLLFVEADMLLSGATPADLSSSGASDYAISVMNIILYRARGNKTESEMYNWSTDTWGYYIYDANNKPVVVAENMKSRYLRDFNKSDNILTFGDLIKERARELCFEFHRWNDLSRWGLLKQRVESPERIYDPALPKPLITTKNYLFPIPVTERQASPNETGFYQNPGY